jgi:hypothetical protein
MTSHVTFDLAGIEPETSYPATDRLISGAPEFTTWNVEEADGGLWEVAHRL